MNGYKLRTLNVTESLSLVSSQIIKVCNNRKFIVKVSESR